MSLNALKTPSLLAAALLVFTVLVSAGSAAQAQGRGGFIVELPDGRVIDVGQSYGDCLAHIENRNYDAAYQTCRDASVYLPLSPGRMTEDAEARRRSDQRIVYAKTAFGVAGYNIGIREPRNVTLILDARREFNDALGIAFRAFPRCDSIIFALHENIINAYDAAGMPNEAGAVAMSAMGYRGGCPRPPG